MEKTKNLKLTHTEVESLICLLFDNSDKMYKSNELSNIYFKVYNLR